MHNLQDFERKLEKFNIPESVVLFVKLYQDKNLLKRFEEFKDDDYLLELSIYSWIFSTSSSFNSFNRNLF